MCECVSINSCLIPGSPFTASSAASPLRSAAAPPMAVAIRTTKAARRKTSADVKYAAMSSANANSDPKIGEWLTSRWRCAPVNMIGLVWLLRRAQFGSRGPLSGGIRLERCFLLCELRPVSPFPVHYVTPVARGIDERIVGAFLQARVFLQQIEVTAMRA